MTDIIQLLPDAVANQIAAGEVIQRPASVVKELVENAIDAGSTKIDINIKEAGRTLIQVCDNGKGMSNTDLRMAFERHATSKIRKADDLFLINTMGFRGEALASIVSVADVEVKTKREDDEIGSFIHISASEVQRQEAVACNVGTVFNVKNLFYNVPARRKFLKSNATEFRHIINEIQRVAMSHPNIQINLKHNETVVYSLPKENARKRIVNIFGKNMNQSLIPIETETPMLKVWGYIGQPKYAKKSFGEQFFFVNGRFMKHPFFHKAIMQSYEKILSGNLIPSYFIFFEIDPASIDINIHPTKTEIKFEDERAIWQLLHASVREGLGKFNVVPSLDFDQAGNFEIPVAPKSSEGLARPDVQINPNFNPFESHDFGGNSSFQSEESESQHIQTAPSKMNFSDGEVPENIPSKPYSPFDEPTFQQESKPQSWESLYGNVQNEPEPEQESELVVDEEETFEQVELVHADGHNSEQAVEDSSYVQLKRRYILTPVKSGLMVIDQKRAHERILFETYLDMINSDQTVSQQLLFPQTIDMQASDAEIFKHLIEDLNNIGFDIREFGPQSFIINGVPGNMEGNDVVPLIDSILASFKESVIDFAEQARENVAASLAQASSIDYGFQLNAVEMGELINNLFTCSEPNFSPSGQKVMEIIQLDEFEKLLKS